MLNAKILIGILFWITKIELAKKDMKTSFHSFAKKSFRFSDGLVGLPNVGFRSGFEIRVFKSFFRSLSNKILDFQILLGL